MNVNSTGAINAICKVGGLKGYQNRLILGVSSALTQPFIDYKNKDVDEETRKYSTARTLIKIGVGTIVGSLTRYVAQLPFITEKVVNLFKINPRFANGLGEVLAVLATVITTIAIDVPVTNAVLNKVLAKMFPDKVMKPDNVMKKDK